MSKKPVKKPVVKTKAYWDGKLNWVMPIGESSEVIATVYLNARIGIVTTTVGNHHIRPSVADLRKIHKSVRRIAKILGFNPSDVITSPVRF